MIVLKILLFILLAVLGIILLALLMPVRVRFSFIGGKVAYGLKYGIINILDSDGKGIVGKLLKKKKDKPEKEKASEDDAENPEEVEAKNDEAASDKPVNETNNEKSVSETEENPEKETSDEAAETGGKKKKTLGETVDFIMGIWRSAKRPLRKILKGFHFSDVYIDFLIANEDAYKCAINYGRISGAVYNLLAQMSLLFTVKLKTIDIEAGFAQKKSRWDAGVKVWFIPMTAVIAGIWFLITYIFRVYLPQRREAKKAAKKSAKIRIDSVTEA